MVPSSYARTCISSAQEDGSAGTRIANTIDSFVLLGHEGRASTDNTAINSKMVACQRKSYTPCTPRRVGVIIRQSAHSPHGTNLRPPETTSGRRQKLSLNWAYAPLPTTPHQSALMTTTCSFAARTISKPVQCEFESHRGHQQATHPGESAPLLPRAIQSGYPLGRRAHGPEAAG